MTNYQLIKQNKSFVPIVITIVLKHIFCLFCKATQYLSVFMNNLFVNQCQNFSKVGQFNVFYNLVLFSKLNQQ